MDPPSIPKSCQYLPCVWDTPLVNNKLLQLSLGCGKLIVCAASLESTPDSLTPGCKVQECKQQVMSYKLLFLGTCVLFLNPCPVNNSMPAFQHLHVNCDRLTRLRTQNNSLARQSTQTNLHARTSFLETQYRICLMNYVNELITSLLIDSLLYKNLLFDDPIRWSICLSTTGRSVCQLFTCGCLCLSICLSIDVCLYLCTRLSLLFLP